MKVVVVVVVLIYLAWRRVLSSVFARCCRVRPQSCACVLSNPKEHTKKLRPKMSLPFVRSFVLPSSNCVNVRSQREIYLGFNTSSQFFFEARERERETKSSLSFFGSAFTRLSLSLSLSRLLLTRHDTERGRTSRRGRLEERARGTFIARVQYLNVFVVASSFFCADKKRTCIHRHADTNLSLIRLDGIVASKSSRVDGLLRSNNETPPPPKKSSGVTLDRAEQ